MNVINKSGLSVSSVLMNIKCNAAAVACQCVCGPIIAGWSSAVHIPANYVALIDPLLTPMTSVL